MRPSRARIRLLGLAAIHATCLATAIAAAGACHAQPIAPEPLWDAPTPMGSAPPTGEPIVPGDEGLYGAAYYAGEPASGPVTRPVNWICGPYLKAGPTAILGEGVLDDPDVGYTISGGFRQPLGPEIGGDQFFLDFGGSYLSAFGETTRTRAGTGVRVVGGVNTFRPVDDAFSNTLKEIKRGGVHAAIGWFWGAPMDDRTWDPQIRVASRIGGRVSHIRGRFSGDQLIALPISANETILPNENVGHTQTVGGLFFGTEAILLQRQYDFGSVQWTLDAELANDWIEFENFESGSLGTASLMFGFVLSR